MCETWVKPDRPIVSGILDRTDGDFYNALGKMVFGDETSRTYLFESFFNDCAIGIPPYVSMSLEDEFEIARKLDFSDSEVYGDDTALVNQFQDIDIAGIDILSTAELQRVTTEMPNAMVPGATITAVNGEVTGELLDTTVDELRTQLGAFSPPGGSGAVVAATATLNAAIDTLESDLSAAVSEMAATAAALSQLQTLYNRDGGLVARAAAYNTDFQAFLAWKDDNLNAAVKDFIQTDTVDRLLVHTDAYKNFVVDFLNNDFGVCEPIITAMDTMHGSVCIYWWSGLDVLWFSLGWTSFFYLPLVILSVKMAKHFRRTQVAGSGDPSAYAREIELTENEGGESFA